MKPVTWALAVVLIVVFGAAAYRIVTSSEPTSIEFLKKLNIDLKGKHPETLPPPAAQLPSVEVTQSDINGNNNMATGIEGQNAKSAVLPPTSVKVKQSSVEGDGNTATGITSENPSKSAPQGAKEPSR